MSIETRFDIALIAAMALKEKQIQQNYRPIIAVHKWFARRPGTLFRGLVLSEFGDSPLVDSFFKANDFPGRVKTRGGARPRALRRALFRQKLCDTHANELCAELNVIDRRL
jgi:hypothetical protein